MAVVAVIILDVIDTAWIALAGPRSWWHDLAKADDPEGHLVLGWLARHGLAPDPDGWPVARRLDAARSAWAVPDWMYETPLSPETPHP